MFWKFQPGCLMLMCKSFFLFFWNHLNTFPLLEKKHVVLQSLFTVYYAWYLAFYLSPYKSGSIFNEDNYTPIYVESVEEYTAIVTQFPFQDEELEQASLPRNEVINLVINFGIKIINIRIWALKVKIKYQNARKFKEPQVDVC